MLNPSERNVIFNSYLNDIASGLKNPKKNAAKIVETLECLRDYFKNQRFPLQPRELQRFVEMIEQIAENCQGDRNIAKAVENLFGNFPGLLTEDGSKSNIFTKHYRLPNTTPPSGPNITIMHLGSAEAAVSFVIFAYRRNAELFSYKPTGHPESTIEIRAFGSSEQIAQRLNGHIRDVYGSKPLNHLNGLRARIKIQRELRRLENYRSISRKLFK